MTRVYAVRVQFEGGTRQVCTPNHKWVLNDGTVVSASNLKPGMITVTGMTVKIISSYADATMFYA